MSLSHLCFFLLIQCIQVCAVLVAAPGVEVATQALCRE